MKLFKFSFVLLLVSCSSLYLDSMERIGYTKRELLRSRTQEAYDIAFQASEHMRTTSYSLPIVPSDDALEARAQLEVLEQAISDGHSRSKQTLSAIESAEVAASALFNEWKTELGNYSSKSATKRSSSEQNLFTTEQHLKQTLASLRETQANLNTVISEFEDKALFFKHLSHSQELTGKLPEYSNKNALSRYFKNLESSLADNRKYLAKR